MEEFDFIYYKIRLKLILAWRAADGSGLLPETTEGMAALRAIYKSALLRREFSALYPLHSVFRQVRITDIYLDSLQNIAIDLITKTPNHFELVFFLRRCFVKESSDALSGFWEWKTMIEKAAQSSNRGAEQQGISLAKQDWFQRFVFLEQMKYDCSENALREYQSSSYHVPLDQLSPSAWRIITDEIMDTFPKVLSTAPQLVYPMLDILEPINLFRESVSPPPYGGIDHRIEADQATSIYYNACQVLLQNYSLEDCIHIYLNSPLHCIIGWTSFIKRLVAEIGEFDLSRTSFSNIVISGNLIKTQDDFYLQMGAPVDEEIRLILSEDSMASISKCTNGTLVSGTLQAYSPYDGLSLNLLPTAPLTGKSDSKYNDDSRRSSRQPFQTILSIYNDISETRIYHADQFRSSITEYAKGAFIQSTLLPHEVLELSLAQLWCFFALADQPDVLAEVIMLSNSVPNGRLNAFFDEPFGSNEFRLDKDVYNNALSYLEKIRSKLKELFISRNASFESILSIYFNSILKRMIALEELLRFEAIYGQDAAKDVLSFDYKPDQLFSRFFCGQVLYVSEKEVGIKPKSFNPGLIKYRYIMEKRKFFPINVPCFFVIDHINAEERVCYLSTISTTKDLKKKSPVVAFRCAMKAAQTSTLHISQSDIRAMLSNDISDRIFHQPWYLPEYRNYFNYHLLNAEAHVLGALNNLGDNNQYCLTRHESISKPYQFANDEDIYFDYLRRMATSGDYEKISDSILVYLNSPIRKVIPLDAVFNLFIIECAVSKLQVLQPFWKHPLKLSDNEEDADILCSHSRLIGEPSPIQEYTVVDYLESSNEVLFAPSVQEMETANN